MMKIATDKKTSQKIITGLIAFSFLISPLSILRAEDYPVEFLGPGYREYLSEKKQSGYYVEVFTQMDLTQKERVDKRNQVEEILASAHQAGSEAADGIFATQFQHKDNADKLKEEINQQSKQREDFANTNLDVGFRYIPRSDGSVEHFKNGLLIRLENERVVDEFGNLSIRNSYNYQYDDNRLLTSFEADIKDPLGNITHTRQYGMKYTPDSLYYGGKDTSANKNLTEYFAEETDPAGNKKLTHFYAGTYEGKFLRAFSQTIEDSIYGNASFTRSNINYAGGDPTRMSSFHEEGVGTDGLAYTLERTDVGYNIKDQIAGYREILRTTQIDGSISVTTTEAKFQYLGVAKQFGPDVEEPDPDKLLESIITQTVENADGSSKTEKSTTNYNYGANSQLISDGTVGHSEFNGREADWIEYTDAAGHILTRKDENGNLTYSYLNPETLERVSVDASQVTTSIKPGNLYQGHSDIQYEALEGKPMVKQSTVSTSSYGQNIRPAELNRVEIATTDYTNGLVNNLVRALASHEKTKITRPLLDPENNYVVTTDIGLRYEYDNKLNKLTQTQGKGGGWEYDDTRGWYGEYKSTITVNYAVILGKPLREIYEEKRDYKE